MVFTHLPSNVLLILIPFAPDLTIAIALLLARSALSQMDVPTRASYVMAVVAPEERPAAASITAVPKTFAWAAGSLISGYLLASRAGEFHRHALLDPYVSLSAHTAPDVQPPTYSKRQ